MNIQQFAANIDKQILGTGNQAVLLDVVKKYSQPEALSELLESAWEQNSDHIIADSYLHPNGFDKLVLVSGETFKLRLHNFHPPKVMKPAESVHNHKWEFASSILFGGYKAQEFDTTGGEQKREHYRYSKEEGLEYVGTTTVGVTDEYEVSKGHSYFMPGDVYHSITRISDQGCITLMMTGYTKETTTNVYSLNELDLEKGRIHCGLKMYEGQEIADTLQAVKTKLNLTTKQPHTHV